MSALETKQLSDGVIEVSLFGNIDERTDFSQVEIGEDTKTINVNLDSINVITSQGVQCWILWLQKHSDKEFKIHNTPQCLIDILNIVTEALPSHMTVESFYVPYLCESDFEVKNILLFKNKDFPVEGVPYGVRLPENVVAPNSGEEMIPDIVEQTYFSFLERN